MNDYDVCVCGHCHVNHHPNCHGIYADGEWEVPDTDRRDCNCKEFSLESEYKEPPKCAMCGRSFDND